MTDSPDAPADSSDAPAESSDAQADSSAATGRRSEGSTPRGSASWTRRGSAVSTRRGYLRRCGGAVGLAAASALAGCPSPNESVFDQTDGILEQSDDDGGTNDGGASEVPEVEPSPINREPDYGDWFDDVDTYENGTVVYQSRRETVTVTVGAAGDGDNRSFQQPAIAVSVDTTVEWEWTGEGGAHNVVEVEGAFDSGSPAETRAEPFRHRFTETGTYRYVCEPHEDDGMRGSVTVYDPDG